MECVSGGCEDYPMTRVFIPLPSAFALTPFVAWGQAFTPVLDGTQATVAVSASTSNATGTITAATGSVFQLRVYNACTTTALTGGVATTSDMPVPAGVVEVLTLAAGTTERGGDSRVWLRLQRVSHGRSGRLIYGCSRWRAWAWAQDEDIRHCSSADWRSN